jgi:hypothetical protein
MFLYCKGEGLLAQINKASYQIDMVYDSSIRSSYKRVDTGLNGELITGDGFVRYYNGTSIKADIIF